MLLKRIINKKGKGPAYLIHFVTSKCNAKCKHCFYWKEINKKEELSLTEIHFLLENSPPIPYVILTGGEPFLRKDLVNIILYYYMLSKTKKIIIATNGSLPEKIKEDVEKTLVCCPKLYICVDISLDGIEKEHDTIRGVTGAFEKVKKTYKALVALKKKSKRLEISIVYTMMKDNQDKLLDTYEYVSKKMPEAPFVVNLIRGGVKNPKIKDIDISYYEKFTDRIIKDHKKGIYKGYINTPNPSLSIAKMFIRHRMIAKTFKEEKYITPCYAASLAAVLSPEGNIYPCELLNKKIGDIYEYHYNLGRLWNSKKAKEIRRFIRKSKCFCTHECFWTVNILFNPRFYPLLLRSIFQPKALNKKNTFT